jgi:hypothetical protein
MANTALRVSFALVTICSSILVREVAAEPPALIGKFDEWTAATHQESGGTACYAFTRAKSSSPTLPNRGRVVLIVSQRPWIATAAVSRVAIEAGYQFALDATVTVQVDQTPLAFYTVSSSAFARNNNATVAAFQQGTQVTSRGQGPQNQVVTDTFSLKGFLPAYSAISKTCR